jgi:PAS domain-containing protein
LSTQTGWSTDSTPFATAQGEITGVTIFGRDITARKQAEALIKDQLSEITFYYDNAPIGLAVLDADLRFVRDQQAVG